MSKRCFNCSRKDTFVLHTTTETLQLSGGRTLVMPDSQSWICSACGDRMYDGKQMDRVEAFIRSHYPDYYATSDRNQEIRKARIAAVERLNADGCPIDGIPGSWLGLL
jgi:YgiT-type zinc finger domain-containing protein